MCVLPHVYDVKEPANGRYFRHRRPQTQPKEPPMTRLPPRRPSVWVPKEVEEDGWLFD